MYSHIFYNKAWVKLIYIRKCVHIAWDDVYPSYSFNSGYRPDSGEAVVLWFKYEACTDLIYLIFGKWWCEKLT